MCLMPGVVRAVDVIEARKTVIGEGGASVTVAVGEYRGQRSPAEVFSPLAGFEVAVPGGDDFVLPVPEDFEYGVVQQILTGAGPARWSPGPAGQGWRIPLAGR